MITDKIVSLIEQSLLSLHLQEGRVEVTSTLKEEYGDFSTNIALLHAKKLNQPPTDVAEQITAHIPKNNIVEKIEVVKPGFINFYMRPSFFLNELTASPSAKANKALVLEFGQPNTHKTPHIGHLFSYIFGESLGRILERTGNKVIRTNYQGDIGLHVAKCLYKVRSENSKVKSLKTQKEKVEFLQKCYQEGSNLYVKDKAIEKEIDMLNKKIYEKDPSIYELWKETREWSLSFYKEFEKRLGIAYDKYFFESETADIGQAIVRDHIGEFFTESEGAVIFQGEKHGLHTRVFINKHGNPTYEAKDIGLMKLKMDNFSFDQSIVATASEQNEYWKVVIKAAELVFPQLKGKLLHLGFGMIQLSTGKMSSRTGAIIDAFSLVDEVKNRIKKEYASDDDSAEKIALASIKYSFLRSNAYKNIIFDLEKSIAKEGDSGPYLLYTYVRTRAVLEKAASDFSPSLPQALHPEEKQLLKKLSLFPTAIQQAKLLLSPHIIAHYLFGLSQLFNVFYQTHQIVQKDKDLQQFRLFLTQQTGLIIKEGLSLLGIKTIEKM